MFLWYTEQSNTRRLLISVHPIHETQAHCFRFSPDIGGGMISPPVTSLTGQNESNERVT